MPLPRAQGQRPLPVGLGHRLQALLGGTDDGGQNHDDQRQAAGQNARLQSKQLEKEQHAHQTKDNGGNPGEGLRGKLNGRHHLPVGGILRQVDGRTHPQREDNDHGQQNDIEGIEKVRQNADGVVDIAGLAGEQFPADVAQPPVKDISNEEKQQRTGDPRAEIQQGAQAPVIRLAPLGKG